MKTPDELADLKTLDPAAHDIDPHSPRAQATLERILAVDPVHDAHPRRRFRSAAVRAAVATAAVAIAATTVLIPRDSDSGGDRSYATWTAQPSTVSAKERAKIASECRERLKGAGYDDEIARTGTSLVDRRGDWVVAFLVGHDGFEATCMINIATGQFGPGEAAVGAGVQRPRPRQLIPSAMGVSGGGSVWAYLTTARGQAGSDIVAMTYQSPIHGRIKATVSEGHFAFWVPGNEFDGTHPVPVQVTYRDGTTANVKLVLGG